MAEAPEKTWFGQPRGLTILFLTNMWEAFSYYGMRALLVYYMTKALLFPQTKASFIYGCYTATAYFTPIFGGIVADRWLGKRRAVIIGGSIMALGHFMMTFAPLFYPALATIALGNGLFLPSLPSQIDHLYRVDDPRRARAFNIYYVGVNIGGFLAPLVCGTLGELYGWHYGFGAAGIGMFAGVAIYSVACSPARSERCGAEPAISAFFFCWPASQHSPAYCCGCSAPVINRSWPPTRPAALQSANEGSHKPGADIRDVRAAGDALRPAGESAFDTAINFLN